LEPLRISEKMKLKRELAATDSSDVPVDNLRTKRRKRGSSVASPSATEDVEMANASSSDVAGEVKEEDESVKELGLKIWNAVRNAKGKE
jgi:chromatin structure-remodeling complex subunit RSC4